MPAVDARTSWRPASMRKQEAHMQDGRHQGKQGEQGKRAGAVQTRGEARMGAGVLDFVVLYPKFGVIDPLNKDDNKKKAASKRPAPSIAQVRVRVCVYRVDRWVGE